MSVKLPKLIAVLTASAIALTACSSAGGESGSSSASSDSSASATAAFSGTIEIEDNHGTVEVPAGASRIAVTDNRSFEILNQWGITPVAVPKQLVPKTVPDYKNNDDIVDLGNHREPDLEALVAAEPDLIINGQRFTQYYEDIKNLNPDTPIIELEPRDGEPLDSELKRQVTALGEALGKQSEADALIADFDAALERAKNAYNGTDTVMGVNVSGGEIGYVAPSIGRVWGPIFDLLGLKPALEVSEASSNHEGDDISVEAIAESNPTWIFVLDRDASLSTADEEGYTPALDVITNNAALGNVTAVKDGKTILAPADTYTNESIITYTEILNSIADAFEGK
ncbi:ABC transporter substrate-binding protein [Corynebacterium sp. SCR221107]|uniref:siderophore ABC transporter substrate-binding protein n=1 Tax=Corynebacterium sp. SCR221107 TaxID=3017361 RepID=UPI0022EC35DB|nr:ABC transporter substrate-binding protein [Corynebacterium sp. SCR221107]WBT09498.1 ABC transporter substrate-binding protein [Corynebacterium sp. SCR221107]